MEAATGRHCGCPAAGAGSCGTQPISQGRAALGVLGEKILRADWPPPAPVHDGTPRSPRADPDQWHRAGTATGLPPQLGQVGGTEGCSTSSLFRSSVPQFLGCSNKTRAAQLKGPTGTGGHLAARPAVPPLVSLPGPDLSSPPAFTASASALKSGFMPHLGYAQRPRLSCRRPQPHFSSAAVPTLSPTHCVPAAAFLLPLFSPN